MLRGPGDGPVDFEVDDAVGKLELPGAGRATATSIVPTGWTCHPSRH